MDPDLKTPLVSIIMPVYNTGKYLPGAIESILNQAYENFEFLIFDDGSSDNSREVIETYAAMDSRIKAFYSDDNKGHVHHLNQGIKDSKGEYIARMDSDDISLANRLLTQVDYLNANPSIAVLGSATIQIDSFGKEKHTSKMSGSSAMTRWVSFFTNPLAHPTVMFRKGIFQEIGYYDKNMVPSEDYDLWLRILRKYEIANIQEPLLKYRIHGDSISVRRSEVQHQYCINLLKGYWQESVNERITKDQAEFLLGFHRGYDQLSSAVSFSVFRKLRSLKRYQSKRYGKLEDSIRHDFFQKSLYLLTKTKKNSILKSLFIFLYLLYFSPMKMVNFVFYAYKNSPGFGLNAGLQQ